MGIFGRIVTFVLGSVLAVGALLFSALLFFALLVIGLALGGYLWWKTRGLRRQMREHMQQAMQQAQGARGDAGAIEGEFVREKHNEGSTH